MTVFRWIAAFVAFFLLSFVGVLWFLEYNTTQSHDIGTRPVAAIESKNQTDTASVAVANPAKENTLVQPASEQALAPSESSVEDESDLVLESEAPDARSDDDVAADEVTQAQNQQAAAQPGSQLRG